MTTTTPRDLFITLPLPPRALSPNGSRGHWASHARYARLYRAACGLVALGQKPDGFPAIKVAQLSMLFSYCHGRRSLDADNALASAKPAIDSLRDAGILADDSARRVSYRVIAVQRHPAKCRCDGVLAVQICEVTA